MNGYHTGALIFIIGVLIGAPWVSTVSKVCGAVIVVLLVVGQIIEWNLR